MQSWLICCWIKRQTHDRIGIFSYLVILESVYNFALILLYQVLYFHLNLAMLGADMCCTLALQIFFVFSDQLIVGVIIFTRGYCVSMRDSYCTTWISLSCSNCNADQFYCYPYWIEVILLQAKVAIFPYISCWISTRHRGLLVHCLCKLKSTIVSLYRLMYYLLVCCSI